MFIAADVDLAQSDGQGVHVISLSRAFAEIGEAVRLLVSRTSQTVPFQAKVEMRAIPNVGFPAFVAALRQVRDFRPDLIYERRFSPKLGAALSLATGVPYYLEINGLPETEQPAAVDGRTPRRRNPPKTMYRVARQIFVPSQRLANLLAGRLHLPPTRFTVVPNAADLSLFRPTEKAQARRVLGLSLESAIVVYVGNLAHWQGLETLVDAAKHLTQIPRLQILIVGDGPVRGSVIERIASAHVEGTIRLMGALPHEKVPLVLSAADVCVAPFTRVRNDLIGISPIKLFEYMAAGRPVVASDVAGVREIMQDAGMLVTPDSPTNLAAAISHLLSNPSKQDELGRRASEISQLNSWEDRARTILSVVSGQPVSAS